MKNLEDHLQIADAAKYVGVCSETLRRWDRAGKLKSCRNPMNGYRLYSKQQLDRLLSMIGQGVNR